jgi:class 3 adenylate cyclase
VTIRRRLASSFLIVLTLFAVNESIQVWSARLRARTMGTVDRALKRQLLMASLQSRIADLHKQISLMGQIDADAGAPPGGREALDGEIARAGVDIQTLIQLSEPADQAAVEDLGKTFGELGEAWRRFYDYLGVEPAWALAFQVKAEPLGRKVVIEQLPALQRQQAQRAEAAELEFADVTRQTQRVSLGIFGGSMLLAIGIAWELSQYLKTRLADLQRGAAMIGLMNLDHRLTIDSSDELGGVAASFNDMAANLAQARHEVTAVNAELVARHAEVEEQRHRSESLLLNILPAQVARELATRGEVAPRYFEDVTILFTDFVGFTLATERLAADEVVSVLHEYFKVFDEIAERYGLEKLKTIGDSYFCAGGLPVRNPSHPIDATLAAFEMIREVERRVLPDGSRWQVRIGLHTGPVVAGVVGTRKFAFDVWGDTVNRASRIETAGAPNRINISSAVQRRIKDFFATDNRGLLATKEGTQLEMFSVAGILPSLLDEGDSCPPARFAARYQTYFDRPLAAFPEFLISSPSKSQAL